MSKIEWLLNDEPSLPVSTLRVDPNIVTGDWLGLHRKLDVLRQDINMELDVFVGFEFEYDNFTGKTTIHVIE